MNLNHYTLVNINICFLGFKDDNAINLFFFPMSSLKKNIIKSILSNKELLQLILFVALPALLLLIYIQKSVDMALTKRQIHVAQNKKKELMSRNRALKTALAEMSKQSGSAYWQSYQDFLPYQNNKIVNIKLPPPIE